MNDPLTSINALPPRYLVESDSEDEEGQGLYPDSGPSKPKIRLANPLVVELKWTKSSTYDAVVLGEGQAGRYLLRKVGVKSPILDVLVDGEKVGEGFDVQGSLVVCVQDLDHHVGQWDVAKALWNGIQAKSWSLLTTYLPALYIPEEGEKVTDGVIRYLSSDPSSLAGKASKLTVPNYATGLAAAVASLASHPTSPPKPLHILSLPLPLSFITTFTSVISAAAPSVGTRIASRADSAASRWSETDDEPYTGTGMGYRRKQNQEATKEDFSGMYM